jgi:hypothetical protein
VVPNDEALPEPFIFTLMGQLNPLDTNADKDNACKAPVGGMTLWFRITPKQEQPATSDAQGRGLTAPRMNRSNIFGPAMY